MRRRDFVRSMVAAGALPLVGCSPRLADGFVPRPPVPTRRLDTGWRFVRGDAAGGASPHLDDRHWEPAILPHTPRVEALVTGKPGSDTYQWQGIAWYRRPIRVDEEAAGRTVLLKFEAAMNVAEVWLDGEPLGRHMGGFLPFVFDITDRVTPGRDSVLDVRLDNTDNPITGPKPLDILDFNMYGGLYRYVHLIVKDPLHITEPILAARRASGGVFVTFPEVSRARARVRVQTHVRNDRGSPAGFRVRTTLLGPDGRPVAESTSDPVTLATGGETEMAQLLDVPDPRLWSPTTPHLHTVRSEVVVHGTVVNAETTRVGIRRIEFSSDGFRINGKRMFMRGTNRHQEHPYVGYAVPEAAHHRDAQRIKDAGFDYIRLSHYPHAPAFMDACDELGLVVMNCIPGWQYFGDDPSFAELQYRNTRKLIRRDRNHPSVVLWEVSLNETAMPEEFVERTHAIAHQEYPGDQMYTCGWVHGYDVFIRARQHGGCRGEEDVPCVVSEYGDWEYYAMTAGLDQGDFEALTPDESNSRQLRWHGEEALLQQATNFQEAHNDNRSGPAVGDGLWVMFDYNRGYAPDIESSGCMDLFRLPKYSYHFFRSQRSPHERLDQSASGPMTFIASEWTPASPLDIRVFSNCEEVELRLDGETIGRRRPDRDRISTHLAHPPFTFTVPAFMPGELVAIAYLDGREAARHRVRTPGPVDRLHVRFDRSGHAPDTRGQDLLFSHAELRDERGTVVADAWENVAFGVTGQAELIGAKPFPSDAGIASILTRTEPGATAVTTFALSIIRDRAGGPIDRRVRVLDAAAALLGRVPAYDVRYTTDGTAPGPDARRYAGPFESAGPVRAALLVAGDVVVSLDERAEKFRIRGSAAPDGLEPFRHNDDGGA